MRRLRSVAIVLTSAIGMSALGLVFVVYGGPSIVNHALKGPYDDGLSFQFGKCESTSLDTESLPEITWENPRIARITGMAEANCGTHWIMGDYFIAGDILTLGYQAVGGYALCDCDFKVSYRIEGLPKKDYRVNLRSRPPVQPVTNWMESPWQLVFLFSVMLSLGGCAIWLMGQLPGRGNAPRTEPEVGITRKQGALFFAILALAAVANIFFWYRAESAQQTALINELAVENLSKQDGLAAAERDFVAGTPRWYRFRNSGGVPDNKVDWEVTTLDASASAPMLAARRSFVEAYNNRMDHLVEQKRRGPRRGPATKG